MYICIYVYRRHAGPAAERQREADVCHGAGGRSRDGDVFRERLRMVVPSASAVFCLADLPLGMTLDPSFRFAGLANAQLQRLGFPIRGLR